MNLDLKLKGVLEKPPAKFSKSGLVISVYSKNDDFIPFYIAEHLKVQKQIPLIKIHLEKKTYKSQIPDIFGEGFFEKEKVILLTGIEDLLKKDRENMFSLLEKNSLNTIVIGTTDYKFQKTVKGKFFTLSVFDIEHWFYKKIVEDKLKSYGVVYDSILLEKILGEIKDKDLYFLNVQIDKLCLYLIDKKEPEFVDIDHVKEALSGRETNYFTLLNALFYNFLSGEYEIALRCFSKLRQESNEAYIVEFLIKRIRLFIEFTTLYDNVKEFKSFADSYRSFSKSQSFQFLKQLREVNTKIKDKVSSSKNGLFSQVKMPDVIKDFVELRNIIKYDMLKKIWAIIIKNDSKLKSGIIKDHENLFLLTIGEVKDADIRWKKAV